MKTNGFAATTLAFRDFRTKLLIFLYKFAEKGKKCILHVRKCVKNEVGTRHFIGQTESLGK